MAKKKAKKSEAEKLAEKVSKELQKLAALHAKEDDIVEKLNDLVGDTLDDNDYL
jgi:DNA-binding SARP family transcriptional activator